MYCKNCGKQLPDGAQFCDGAARGRSRAAMQVNAVTYQWPGAEAFRRLH